jgi:hypothetical protein
VKVDRNSEVNGDHKPPPRARGVRNVKRGALVRIGIVLATFAILHLAGGRAAVGWLSGTIPGGFFDHLLGALYVLAWFATVIVVPIVTLALLLDAACGRIMAHRPWRIFRRP